MMRERERMLRSVEESGFTGRGFRQSVGIMETRTRFSKASNVGNAPRGFYFCDAVCE